MLRQHITTVGDTTTWREIIELIFSMAVCTWCMVIEVQRANQPCLDQECSEINWRCPRGWDTACSKIGCNLAHDPLEKYEDFFMRPYAKLRVYKLSSPDKLCRHREKCHLAESSSPSFASNPTRLKFHLHISKLLIIFSASVSYKHLNLGTTMEITCITKNKVRPHRFNGYNCNKFHYERFV